VKAGHQLLRELIGQAERTEEEIAEAAELVEA